MEFEFIGIESLDQLILKHSSTDVYKRELNIPLSKSAITIMQDLNNRGFKPLIVGGAVRDAVIGNAPKDIDIEVYNISYDDLSSIVSQFGSVNLVGKSFGVIKFTDSEGNQFDFSIPRRDSKIENSPTDARGRGFTSTFDISISPKDAAARRDFTVNSLAYDPFTQELHDYFGGISDIENRILKATSPAFIEDPLRVLRGMQFASRFNMSLDPETAKMAASLKNQPLVQERVSEEWMKLFEKGKYPSKVIQYLIDTKWIDNYPELKSIIGLEQDPIHHPEGTVDIHTALTMDASAKLADENGIQGDDRAVLLMAALTHDLGKATTTDREFKDGREQVTSYGHHLEGAKLADSLLKRIGIKKSLRDQVIPLVAHHMTHIFYSKDSKKNTVKHIAESLFPATFKQLEYVIKSDMAGRGSMPRELPQSAIDMLDTARNEGVYGGRVEPLLQGKDILETFPLIEPSPIIGEVLRYVYDKQLEGSIKTKEDALAKADIFFRSKMAFINGNDVLTVLGGEGGPHIKEILDTAWKAQLNGEFNTKEDAIKWLQGHYGTPPGVFSGIKSVDQLLKYANERLIIIMRGAPGSGKSYKAQQLSEQTGGKIFASDDFWMMNGEYQFDPSRIAEAHQWNMNRVREAAERGDSVIIVDNTNTRDYEVKPYVLIANEYGYRIKFEEPDSSWWKENFKENMTEEETDKLVDLLDKKNVHNVPKDVIKTMISGWNHNITPEQAVQSKAPWEE